MGTTELKSGGTGERKPTEVKKDEFTRVPRFS